MAARSIGPKTEITKWGTSRKDMRRQITKMPAAHMTNHHMGAAAEGGRLHVMRGGHGRPATCGPLVYSSVATTCICCFCNIFVFFCFLAQNARGRVARGTPEAAETASGSLFSHAATDSARLRVPPRWQVEPPARVQNPHPRSDPAEASPPERCWKPPRRQTAAHPESRPQKRRPL